MTSSAGTTALSVVIPLYRSVDTLDELLTTLDRMEIPGGHEIVLVNDGSPDETGPLAEQLIKKLRTPATLVHHSRNYGEHNAVMTGFRHARGAHVITMDDDLQNPVSEVKRLHAHAVATGADVVYTYYEEKKHAIWRNFGSRFTNWIANFLLDKPKELYLCSFRCLSQFVAHEAVRYSGPYPYVDGLILQITQRIERLQVQHVPRQDGVSGYTFRRLVRLWLNMFVNFSVMPLRLATVAGFALGAMGAVCVLLVVVEHVVWGTPLGWGSLMSALLIFSGAQLVMLGVIGEYVGRLYLTANRKPQSTVRRVVRTGDPQGTAACDARDAPGAHIP